MKRAVLFASLVLIVVLASVACGGAAPTPTPAAPAAGGLATDYADAASVRNQLALGIMRLENTPQAITAAQAKQLAPLWQALKALTTTSTTVTAEVEAMQTQIIGALTPEQTAAIAAMRLTNATVQEYYVAIGVSEARTPEAGTTPLSSTLKSLSPEQRESARATAQAAGTPVGSAQGNRGMTVLIDNVLALLAAK